ncbi:MAG: metallophosphoesterase [Anaerolineales bacterium]
MQTTFWAIGDLHLSFYKPRNMTRFGAHWADHEARIAESWRANVHPDDVVLLLGDTSFGNTPRRVQPDLEWLSALPGRKVMIRGNHDRWWTDIHKVRRLLPKQTYALQGDCLTMDGILLCGAQGHIAPQDPYYKPDPPHNRYEREIRTLYAAITAAQAQRQPDQPLIVMMHYPPFTSDGKATAFSHMVESLAPAQCLYAHLHRQDEWAVAVHDQTHNGIYYRLLAADFVDMMLHKISL